MTRENTSRASPSNGTRNAVEQALRGGMRRVLSSGAFDEHDVEIRRRIVFIHFISLVGVANLFPLAVAAWLADARWLAVFDLAVGLFLIANLIYLRRTGRYAVAATAGVSMAGALFIYLFATGGVEGTGHLWSYTFPLLTAFLLGSTWGAVAALVLLLPALCVLATPVVVCPYVRDYPPEFAIRFVPSYLVVLVYSVLFERLREGSHRSLSAKHEELAEVVLALREKEHALEAAQERLEQRVQERTADLNVANVELQHEIRDRRSAEAELQRSHDRFTTVVDSMDAWVYAADLETYELLFMNRNMRDALGDARPGESCYHAIFGEDAPCSDCPTWKLDRGGDLEPRRMVTWEGWNPKTRRWLLHHARAARWVDGRTVRVQVTTDITKRKAAEEENAQLQSELLQAQKMEALGTLAGGVAHDLNNILSGVIGYPDLLLLDLPDASPMRTPLSRIRESGEKCARIVQDLLALARRGVAHLEPVDLNNVTRTYFGSPEFEALRLRHPEVRITDRLDEELPAIAGSPHQLAKTLMNLVTNAVEAIPGAGEVVVTTSTRRVDEPVRGNPTIAPGLYAVLTVEDDGVGIPAERVPRIFEPFFTTKVMGRSGSGLGMAVVWATVQDHEGTIDVKSEEGAGTTMTLHFPLRGHRTASESPRQTDLAACGRGERILVVDDVPEQRELADMVLNRLGYRTEVAESGEAALEAIRQNRYDLLVLDMVMDPGIDGLETFQRAREIDPEIRAVITSGFSESERVRTALSQGVGALVRKPFLIREISEAIRRELSRP